jgi:hypothetical protein
MTNDGDGALAVVARDDTTQAAPPAAPAAPTRPADRWAFLAFVVVAVVSIPLLLRLGHDRWFQYDDWDFLASRDAGNLRDLF